MKRLIYAKIIKIQSWAPPFVISPWFTMNNKLVYNQLSFLGLGSVVQPLLLSH